MQPRPPSSRAPRLVRGALIALVVLALAPDSRAQSGVSDDRVAVPDGPGSVEGLGDNAVLDRNLGMMSFAVPFEVPRGFPKATPAVELSYNAGASNSIVGIGWTLATSSIERMTLRGLPVYSADDELVADGSTQLVRVGVSGGRATYRARHEAGFVRYTWHDAGAAGCFTAEYPDGSVGYFGATSAGTLVPDARLADPGGATFRYHLVERVDPHDHRVVYEYQRVDGVPYLVRIGYVHDAAGTPRYTVTFGYGARADEISDCKPGFEERVTRRLTSVTVAARGEIIRRYVLTYEPASQATWLSRLASVEQFGRDGGRYPVAWSFRYSRTLGGVCTGPACGAPFVASMGALPTGSAMRSGTATLIDINGDALPDVLDTSTDGPHAFILNRLDAGDRSSFDPQVRHSAVGTRSAFSVERPTVQELDVDGNGLADLIDVASQRVLCNDGSGDWTTASCQMSGDLGLPLAGGSTDPAGVRFLDVDGDRRVDALMTSSATTINVRRNTGTGFAALAGAEPIGVAFDQARLFLADLNGDGLLDPVHVFATGAIRHRKHLGRARWSAWLDVEGPALTASQLEQVRFEDLNGDGLDDLVLVEPGAVSYALNHSGHFETALSRITPTDVPGLPVRAADTAVLFADMNANGSLDVVWIQRDGEVAYLELFPVLPNLLSRVENGVGLVQEISYGTAAAERRADPAAWPHLLPVPANVVTRVDTWTTLTGGEGGAGLHEVTTYRYRGGYYAGRERELRGYAVVEATTAADGQQDTQEPGRTIDTYDVGATDTYRKGRLLTSRRFGGAGADERALDEVQVRYEDCAVAGVPAAGLTFPVRHVCEVERTTTVKEGAAPDRWVTLRVTTAYDGYGRVTLSSNLGVDGVDGDEAIVATEYVDPATGTGGRWRLDLPTRVRRLAGAGGDGDETSTYYDGPAFVGLPLGQATRGDATRVTVRRDATAVVEARRASFDVHGNVAVELDALGDPGDDRAHRRTYGYDATGLRVIRTDVHVGGTSPYRLRREYSYDPAFDGVSEATGWMVVGPGAPVSARKTTGVRYDEFARRIAIVQPGDTEATPTVEYQWFLGNPASRIVERTRSTRGGPLDLERVICLDGRGRTFQERTRIAANQYQVSGFFELNSRGAPVRIFQPYLGTSGFCDTSAPADVLFEQVRHDALQREILRRLPAAEPGGTPPERATVFGPLVSTSYDEDDLDPTSPGADTPTHTLVDGLGRVVAVERVLRAGEPGAITRARYDALGRLAEVTDAAGRRKLQRHDLLGRVLQIDDPVAGTSRYEYDDAGNLIGRTDARGVTTRREYDGANRVLAIWDAADPDGTAVRIRYDFGGSCAPADCGNGEGQAVEISYPLDGELVARLGGDARGVDHAGFDTRGQRIFDARTLGGARLATHREFDNAGRLTATIHPDGRRIERRHDGAARPIAVGGVIDEARYGDRGELAALVRANGVTETWQHDGQMRLRRRAVAAADGSMLEANDYTRNQVGSITALTSRDVAASFAHDGWQRLLVADFAGDAAQTQTRTYSLTDDVLSITSTLGGLSPIHAGALGYDDARPGAVTSARGLAYAHDAAGQMVARGDVTFTWDHLGRLVEATRAGASVARFSYAAGVARVARIEGDAITIYATDDYEVRDGIGVAYPRVGRRRLARLESAALAPAFLGDPAPVGGGDGEVNAADAWVAHGARAGLVATSAPAAVSRTYLRSAARRLLLEAGDGAVMLHADHLGSVDLATDAGGRERGRRRFPVPAGDRAVAGHVDEHGFSGQEEVASLGLIRFEHRWLDPLTLRWTQPDPLFEEATALSEAHAGELVDRYAYVGNALVDAIDPTGLARGGGLRPAAAQAGQVTARLHVVGRERDVRQLSEGYIGHAWVEVTGHGAPFAVDFGPRAGANFRRAFSPTGIPAEMRAYRPGQGHATLNLTLTPEQAAGLRAWASQRAAEAADGRLTYSLATGHHCVGLATAGLAEVGVRLPFRVFPWTTPDGLVRRITAVNAAHGPN